MAVCARNVLALAFILFPAATVAYRPFDIPTNLFTPGLKDASLPEGTREISWQDSELLQNPDNRESNSWSDEGKHPSRTRRAVSGIPPSSPSASPVLIEVNGVVN